MLLRDLFERSGYEYTKMVRAKHLLAENKNSCRYRKYRGTRAGAVPIFGVDRSFLDSHG